MPLVLVGPSGSGKSRFEEMCEHVGFNRVISHTTRARRPGDRESAYHHVSSARFDEMLGYGEFVEYTCYCGNKYGASKAEFVEPCVVVVEPGGLLQLKKAFGTELFSIYFDVPEEIRFQRCIARGDSPEYALSRIEKDRNIFNTNTKEEVSLTVRNDNWEDLRNLLTYVQNCSALGSYFNRNRFWV